MGFPNLTNIVNNSTENLLESVVQNPLYVQDPLKATLVGLTINIFSNMKFFLPNKLELLKLETTNYHIFQDEISNGIVKRQPSIEISAIRELNPIQTLALNTVTNTFIQRALKDYSTNGGLFTLITTVGLIDNLLLTDLSVTYDSNGTNPNPVFRFVFKRMSVSDNLTNNLVSKSIRNSICI